MPEYISMESTNFLAWLLTLGGMTLFAIVVMVRAYRTPKTPLFPDAMTLNLADRTEPPVAIAAFEQGIEAFQAQRYGPAVEAFTEAIAHSPDFAEAFHNRGRAFANLNQQPQALRSLLQASDAYALNENPVGLAQIKQDLNDLTASP
jgi:tetratricopeptide (TPR) repeat protein